MQHTQVYNLSSSGTPPHPLLDSRMHTCMWYATLSALYLECIQYLIGAYDERHHTALEFDEDCPRRSTSEHALSCISNYSGVSKQLACYPHALCSRAQHFSLVDIIIDKTRQAVAKG